MMWEMSLFYSLRPFLSGTKHPVFNRKLLPLSTPNGNPALADFTILEVAYQSGGLKLGHSSHDKTALSLTQLGLPRSTDILVYDYCRRSGPCYAMAHGTFKERSIHADTNELVAAPALHRGCHAIQKPG